MLKLSFSNCLKQSINKRPLLNNQKVLFNNQKSLIHTSNRLSLPRVNSFNSSYNNFNYNQSKSQFSTPQGKSQLVKAGLILAGGAVGIQFLNRETRQSPLSAFQTDYLNSTFAWLGGGIATVSGFAVAFHRMGWSYRLMTMSPLAFAGISLVGSIGSLWALRATDPQNKGQKTALFFLFNAAQAATLSPLMFFNPALLMRAGLLTAGSMGAVCYIGATAKSDKFLYLGTPLLGGLAVVALSSLAPLLPLGQLILLHQSILFTHPSTGTTALTIAESLSIYGGLAVFGGFTLYDTQRILAKARMIEQGYPARADPLNESISLELNFINIFTRILYILAGQQNNKRR